MTKEFSYSSPLEVYHAFQESMLSDTEDWKALLGKHPIFKGPSIHVEGRKDFIEKQETWFESIEKQETHKIATCDDLVIAHLSITIKTKHQKSITLNVVEWYEIPNNKIESVSIFMDTTPLKKFK